MKSGPQHPRESPGSERLVQTTLEVGRPGAHARASRPRSTEPGPKPRDDRANAAGHRLEDQRVFSAAVAPVGTHRPPPLPPSPPAGPRLRRTLKYSADKTIGRIACEARARSWGPDDPILGPWRRVSITVRLSRTVRGLRSCVEYLRELGFDLVLGHVPRDRKLLHQERLGSIEHLTLTK